MNFLKLLILPFLVVSFSYGMGGFDMPSISGGNSSDNENCNDAVEEIVDKINGATESTYVTFKNDLICKDYKFKTEEPGYITVRYIDENSSNSLISAGDTNTTNKNIYDTNSTDGVPADFTAFLIEEDTDYYIRIQTKSNIEHKYDIEFDFVATPNDVKDVKGICAGTEEEDKISIEVGCVKAENGDIKIPIINSGDANISDIRVIYKKDGGDKSFGKTSCDIYPGENGDYNESCVYNGIERGLWNFREHTLPPDQEYYYDDHNDSTSNDRNETYLIITNTGVSYNCSDIDLTILYTSNGKTYKGGLDKCVEPTFCYDYAYEQNGRYFTEENNGTALPRLIGKVDDTKDIGIKFYIESNNSKANMLAKNMKVDILEINTTQAKYEYNSTMKTLPKSVIQESITDNYDDEDSEAYVEDDEDEDSYRTFINNINIGNVEAKDRFYTHFKVNELNTSEEDENTTGDDINISLNIKISYDLAGEHRTLTVGADEINMCRNGGASYLPKPGLFNVVHKPIYEADEKYNIPTQVSSRVANMELLSIEEDTNDTLEAKTTIVAVEIIDVSAFHYTEATCQEQDSSINSDKKVWIVFDDDNKSDFDKTALDQAIIDKMTSMTTSSEFYQNIRRGLAYRVSYNTPDEDNADYITLDKNGDEYNITNISGLDDNDNNCLINYKTDKVKDRCDDGFMNKDKLTQCMECLYGGVENEDSKTGTSFVCSRDNFSIRPEAFKITVKDQNQENGNSVIQIGTNEGNLTHPITSTEHLAGGYKYKMEINATNFLNSDATSGYTSLFKEKKIEYIWYPNKDKNVSGCNDDSNYSTPATFIDGKIEQNSSIDQVGRYKITYLDKMWTSSDWNETEMEHHEGDYFYDKSVPDCTEDSTIVYDEGDSDKDHKNGCNISSEHNNTENNTSFRDYNVTIHPYKFYKDFNDINISIGTEHNQTINDNNMSFIYMSNMANDNDENMSFHLNGYIRASGKNDSNLTNFVTTCYAKDIAIDINTTDRVHPLTAFQYRFKTFENNGTLIYDSNATDFNNTNVDMIHIGEGNFSKDSNGSILTILNLNYNRDKGNPVNAMSVRYHNYIIDCNNSADCKFDANLERNISAKNQALDINKTIKHYYGRTHASRQRYSGSEGVANIYYEVYCFDNPDGKDCNKSMLQDGTNSNRSSDIRWYINSKHTSENGVAGVVTEKDNINNVTEANTTGNHPDVTTLMKYNGSQGYPYKTTMENNASEWLIYNAKDINSNKNKFSVEFESNNSIGWSGAHETNTSTKTSDVTRVNRRSMW